MKEYSTKKNYAHREEKRIKKMTTTMKIMSFAMLLVLLFSIG